MPDITEDLQEVKSEYIAEKNGVTEETLVAKSVDGKRTRTKQVAKTPGKVDAKSVIASMKEKVCLLEYLDAEIKDFELPTAGVSAKAREILIKLQKSIEQAKNVTITEIQNL